MSISIISLITWICAAGCGLYLVSIWLIEYDRDFQKAAKTRLPPLVLASHVVLAGGGLIAWAVWFVWWTDKLVWAAALALLLAATLGSIMAIRWIGVYREFRAIRRAATEEQAVSQPGAPSAPTGRLPGWGSSRQVATLDRPIAIG